MANNDWPDRRLAWGAVAILTIAQFVNALDRYLINLLVEPIKADLQVSDTQIGLLLGLAFAIFYTFMGLPIGRWADTYSRRLIIACGLLFWSLMTMACGLAQNFKQLFAARMAVGAGEASLNPCGYSLISDYFPSESRATPMGVFIVGAGVGSAVVLYGGGHLVDYLTVNQITWPLPWGGHLKPWQIAFVIAGLPGLAVMLLIGLMKEPPRRELATFADATAQDKGAPRRALPVAAIVAYARNHAAAYLTIFFGIGMSLLWLMGNITWAPSYLIRTFDWSASEAGGAMALIMLFGNSIGVVGGGYVSERIAKRGYKDAHLRTAFFGTLIALPFAVAAPLIASPSLSVLLLIPAFLFGSFPLSLAPAAIAAITPNQMRAQLTALYLLTINLLGYGAGPAVIGGITDHLYGDPELVGHSMATVAACALPVSLLLLWWGMAVFGRTVKELELASRTTP
ncbi:MAG: spinster family MFS transporter [Parahaliea sp.]